MAYATRPIRNSWTAGGPVATLVVALLLVGLAPVSPAHARSRAPVALAWEGVPEAVAVGDVVPLVLRITARTQVSLAVVEAVFREDWALAGGALPWMGPLEEGQEVEIPVTARLTGEGDYTVGARATAGEAVSGTAFHVRAEGGTAYLTPEPESVMRLRRATGPDDLERMGVAAPPRPPAARAAVRAATSGTVSGNAHWVDPEGHPHPIRGARVQVFDDAPGGTVLAVGITGVNGEYAHSVTAPSGRVSVRVMTEDGLGGLAVVVFPAGTPSARFILEAGPVALSGAVTLDLTTSRPTRGSPGSPGSSQGGALIARAFSVFDALVVYTLQAVALVGRPLPTVSASFPFPDPSGSGSGYNPTTKILQITLADSFDWDVLGHEMFHMIFDRVSPRPVDTAGPGLSGRELGLRGAWSEGLPDYFAVALQVSPMATLASFPGTLLNVGNARSEDTEDASTVRDLESGQGSGCQSSFGYQTACTISALLWDVFDSDDDGTTVREAISGIPPIGVWNAITSTLPCDPCDRVDRLWAGILGFFGPFNPTVFDLADVFVVNRLAPEAKDPPDGTTVRGPNPPTFTWIKNGDSRSSDEYDDFVLAFSRDNFQAHLVPIPVPSGAASYTPTPAEWQRILQGGNVGDAYKWLVAAKRTGSPEVPETTRFYSNRRSITAGVVEIHISWDNVGADVDLHLLGPSTEIAFYSREPGWGFLTQDCIETCGDELIHVFRFPETGTYTAFAHYFDDCMRGPSTVRAEVILSGVKVLDTTFVLLSTGDQQVIGEAFIVASQPSGLEAVPAGTAGPTRPLVLKPAPRTHQGFGCQLHG